MVEGSTKSGHKLLSQQVPTFSKFNLVFVTRNTTFAVFIVDHAYIVITVGDIAIASYIALCYRLY